jgi:hypothetical protein
MRRQRSAPRSKSRAPRLELLQLEGRELLSVTITPLAGDLVAGAVGYQVEFREANFDLRNDVNQVDALFALLPSDGRVQSQAFDNGVGLIHYLDSGPIGFPAIPPRDVGSSTLAQTTKGSFNDHAEDDNLGMMARGILFIPRAGTWNFTVASDDGFRLVMGTNHAIVARFDGTRAYDSTTGQAIVDAPGYYPFELTWYQGNGPAACDFYANGPGQPKDHLVGDPAGLLTVSQIVATAPTKIQTASGVSATTTFSFTTANPNAVASNFTATVRWGDGTASAFPITSTATDGTFPVTASHVYGDEGHFAVSVTIVDNDTGIQVTTLGTAIVTAPVVPPAQVSGFVFVDANDNGLKDPGEVGIPGTTVTLTGKDKQGNVVSRTTITDQNGFYLFDKLPPSDSDGYTLTEKRPTGFLAGNSAVSIVHLNPGNSSLNNNFAELVPATVSGFVFLDANGNGIKDPNETGIVGVLVSLIGVDDRGQVVRLTRTVAADGSYVFTDLRPGKYVLTATLPPGPNSNGTGGLTVISPDGLAFALPPGAVAGGFDFRGTVPGKPANPPNAVILISDIVQSNNDAGPLPASPLPNTAAQLVGDPRGQSSVAVPVAQPNPASGQFGGGGAAVEANEPPPSGQAAVKPVAFEQESPRAPFNETTNQRRTEAIGSTVDPLTTRYGIPESQEVYLNASAASMDADAIGEPIPLLSTTTEPPVYSLNSEEMNDNTVSFLLIWFTITAIVNLNEAR